VKKLTKNMKKRLKKKLKKVEGKNMDSDKDQTSSGASPVKDRQSTSTKRSDDVNDLSDILLI